MLPAQQFAHGVGDDDAGHILQRRRAPVGQPHHTGQHGFDAALGAHPGLGFEMLGGVEAQLQGQEIRAGQQFLLRLQVLRGAFFLTVFERVQRRAQQPFRAVLAGNLQRGHRLQIAHGRPSRIMARQAVPTEQQQLRQAPRLHRVHLAQQVGARAILAREMQQR